MSTPFLVSIEQLINAGLSTHDATAVCNAIASLSSEQRHNPALIWHHITTSVLRPEHPFPVHQLLARAVFGVDNPHPPLWTPTDVASTNLARFMRFGYKVRS